VISSIDRLQTPYRSFFLQKLSANYRPQGRVGNVLRGQPGLRAAAAQRGIILIEANDNNVANHTVEVSMVAASVWSATGGTPASATISSGTAFDAVDYAAAGQNLITAVNSGLIAKGERMVAVP
jgi:hypothetical protein